MQSTAHTGGLARDALTVQVQTHEQGNITTMENSTPDAIFTVEQQQRLEQLMNRWRNAREAGQRLIPKVQTELEDLMAAEVRGASQRAACLDQELSQ